MDFAVMTTEEFVAYVEAERAAGNTEALAEAKAWARSQPPQRIVGRTAVLSHVRRAANANADLFVAYVEAKRAEGDTEAVEKASEWVRGRTGGTK